MEKCVSSVYSDLSVVLNAFNAVGSSSQKQAHSN